MSYNLVIQDILSMLVQLSNVIYNAQSVQSLILWEWMTDIFLNFYVSGNNFNIW